MRISHPRSGMIVYLSKAEYDEFQVKPTDRFHVSAWLEGTTVWVKVERGTSKEFARSMLPYEGNDVTPWHVRGPCKKDTEGRFHSELDVPEFGLAVPLGAVVDDNEMLIEVGEVSRLKSPQNTNRKLGLDHHRGPTKNKLRLPYTEQDVMAMFSSEDAPSLSLVDDGRVAIKAAVDLINKVVQEGGRFRFCINRDGVSHRLKKGDSIKAKIITEEDL